MRDIFTFKQCNDDPEVMANYDTFKDCELFGQSGNVRVVVSTKGFVFEVDKGAEVFFFAIGPDTMAGMVEALETIPRKIAATNGEEK